MKKETSAIKKEGESGLTSRRPSKPHPCICCEGLEKALPSHCLPAQAQSTFSSACPGVCGLTSLHAVRAPFPTSHLSEPVKRSTNYFS